jgi:hypothetical protein
MTTPMFFVCGFFLIVSQLISIYFTRRSHKFYKGMMEKCHERERYYLSVIKDAIKEEVDTKGEVTNSVLRKEIERVRMIQSFGPAEYFKKHNI